MTRAIPFSKAQLKRAIAAAQESGLRVTGIEPDGTLRLADPGDDPATREQLEERWLKKQW